MRQDLELLLSIVDSETGMNGTIWLPSMSYVISHYTIFVNIDLAVRS